MTQAMGLTGKPQLRSRLPAHITLAGGSHLSTLSLAGRPPPCRSAAPV